MMENMSTKELLETIGTDFWTPKSAETNFSTVFVLDDKSRKAMVSRLKRNHPEAQSLFAHAVNRVKELPSISEICAELKKARLIIPSLERDRPSKYNGLVEGLLLIGSKELVDQYFKRVSNTPMSDENTPERVPYYQLEPGEYWTTKAKGMKYGTLISSIEPKLGQDLIQRMRDYLGEYYGNKGTLFTAGELACKEPKFDLIFSKLEEQLHINFRKSPPSYNGLVFGLGGVGLHDVVDEYFEKFRMIAVEPMGSEVGIQPVSGGKPFPVRQERHEGPPENGDVLPTSSESLPIRHGQQDAPDGIPPPQQPICNCRLHVCVSSRDPTLLNETSDRPCADSYENMGVIRKNCLIYQKICDELVDGGKTYVDAMNHPGIRNIMAINIKLSCVIVNFRVVSPSGLRNLRDLYDNGKLLVLMKRWLVTPSLLCKLGVRSLELKVRIDKKELDRCQEEIDRIYASEDALKLKRSASWDSLLRAQGWHGIQHELLRRQCRPRSSSVGTTPLINDTTEDLLLGGKGSHEADALELKRSVSWDSLLRAHGWHGIQRELLRQQCRPRSSSVGTTPLINDTTPQPLPLLKLSAKDLLVAGKDALELKRSALWDSLLRAHGWHGIQRELLRQHCCPKSSSVGTTPLINDITDDLLVAGKEDGDNFPTSSRRLPIRPGQQMPRPRRRSKTRPIHQPDPPDRKPDRIRNRPAREGSVKGTASTLKSPPLWSPSPLQVPINFLGDFKAGKSSLAASLQQEPSVRVAGSPSPLQVPINFLGDVKAGKSSLAASLQQEPPVRVAGYISKGDPKDFRQFVIAFGNTATKQEVSAIADYLFESSSQLFKETVVSADDRIEYEEGKKSGRRLISTLKEKSVITKLDDGTFNYTELGKILYAVNLGRLCDRLLQRKHLQ